jgi:tetratricopeptide (TPR) repeat protein
VVGQFPTPPPPKPSALVAVIGSNDNTPPTFAGLQEAFACTPVRDGFDRLGEVGEAGFRSTVGGLLAEALVRLDRNDEAAQVLDIVDAIAQLDDVDPQVRSRSVRAKILAKRGRRPEAKRLAREVVEIAARTDYLVLHADALLALAAVLGESEQAVQALRNALELFEQKQTDVQADQTRALLAVAARNSHAPQTLLGGGLPLFRAVDNPEVVAADAEAARRPVIPLHEHLQRVHVIGGSAQHHGGPVNLDAPANDREPDVVVPIFVVGSPHTYKIQ